VEAALKEDPVSRSPHIKRTLIFAEAAVEEDSVSRRPVE
jgi:hypothetical protein